MRTVGVEEELLVVGRVDRRPTASAQSVVDGVLENAALFESEFKQEQAELGSDPTESIETLGAQLLELRVHLMESARRSAAEVVAIATSPFKIRPTATKGERYARMTEEFGLLARQQLTCGQHVHVSVESPDEAIGVLDRIRPWLHVLAAISSNSPFWQGQDSGYASYRTVMWGLWPTAGPTDAFGSLAGYRRLVDELLASGAAMDEGMLYFDARPSARYPTLEIRVADVCTDVADAQLIAALARALGGSGCAGLAQRCSRARGAGRAAAGRRVAGVPIGVSPATWSTPSGPAPGRRGRSWTRWCTGSATSWAPTAIWPW